MCVTGGEGSWYIIAKIDIVFNSARPQRGINGCRPLVIGMKEVSMCMGCNVFDAILYFPVLVVGVDTT